MRCEELEAIVFSGREITAEERAEMEAHAKTCEACRALMDNADTLRGMQRIDE
ncbi:MAG: zf-HC2 domain-containing protein, partial [Christensenellales bacterium]